MWIFVALFAIVTIVFLIANITGGSDHIFSPFPGYIFLFSLYFLLGTLSLPETMIVTDKQWLLYSLAIAGFAIGCALALGIRRLARRKPRRIPAIRTMDRPREADEADAGEQGEPAAQAVPQAIAVPQPPSPAQIFHSSLNIPMIMVLWIASVSITLALWAQYGVPLFSANVDKARVDVASNGYIATLGTTIDICAVFAFAFLVGARRRRKDWRFLVCLLVVLSFAAIAILSGSRSRLMKLAIPAVVILHFAIRRIPFKAVLLLIPTGILFIGTLGYYRAFARWGSYMTTGLDPQLRGAGVWGLIVFYAKQELNTAAYGLNIVLQMIPERSPFTWGWLHIGPFLTPFQIKVPIPGNYFKDMINGTWDGVGLAATFVAPMYADFGEPGVFFLSIAYAIPVMLLYMSARNRTNMQYYNIVTYAILLYFLLSAMRSDMVSFEIIWFMTVAFLLRVLRFKKIRLRG